MSRSSFLQDQSPLFVAASVGGLGLWLLVAFSQPPAASVLLLVLAAPLLALLAAAPVALLVAPLWLASQRFGLRSAVLFSLVLGILGAVGYFVLAASVAPGEPVSAVGQSIVSAWVAAVSFAYAHLKGSSRPNDG